MGYPRQFWIGMAFFIIGLLMIWLGSPTQLEMTGSVCSIAGFIWGVVWAAVSPVTQEIRQMREDLLRALGEIRDLLKK